MTDCVILYSKYLPNTLNPKPEELGSWNLEKPFIPHYLSCVTCHLSPVTWHFFYIEKKFRIRETKNLSTVADSSTTARKLLSIFFLNPSPPPPPPRGFLAKEGWPIRGLELNMWPEGQWEALKNKIKGDKQERSKDVDTHRDSMKDLAKGRFFENWTKWWS